MHIGGRIPLCRLLLILERETIYRSHFAPSTKVIKRWSSKTFSGRFLPFVQFWLDHPQSGVSVNGKKPKALEPVRAACMQV